MSCLLLVEEVVLIVANGPNRERKLLSRWYGGC